MIASGVTFELLQHRFVTGLDRRLSHLSACLEALRGPFDEECTPAVLDDMMRGFHNLVGIGGTYGFGKITDVASIGEVACLSVELPVSEPDVTMLDDVLASLRSAAAFAARQTALLDSVEPS